MEPVSDNRITIRNQDENLADATINIYEYGTDTVIVRVSVVSIIDRDIYSLYFANPKTTIILPDHLRFAMLEEKLKVPKCADKYVAGQSMFYDPLMDTPIADDGDLDAAVRYQFLMHKVRSIVLEVQTPTAVTIPLPATPTTPAPATMTAPSAPTREMKRKQAKSSDESSDSEQPTSRRRKTYKKAKNAKKRDRQQHTGGSAGKPPGDTNISDRSPSGTNNNQQGPSKEVLPPDASPKSKRKLAAQKLKEFERQQKVRDHSDHVSESESETEDQRRKRIADEVKDQEAALLHAKTRDEFQRKHSRSIEHCDQATWDAAELFYHLPVGTLKRGGKITLPEEWDLNIDFRNYQLVEAYVLYLMELSEKNGFVLGNMMGLGKTRSCILVILIGHIHLLMHLHRLKYPHQHLPLQPAQDGEPAICQSQGSLPITCFCNPASPLYGKEPRLCPTLGSGSGRSIDAWKKEIEVMGLLDTKWCDPKTPSALRFICMDGNFKEIPDAMGPFTSDEYLEMRVRVDVEDVLKAHNEKVPERTYKKARNDYTERPLWSLVGTIENHPDATPTRPSPTAGRFIILCGENTVESRVLKATKNVTVRLKRTITHGGSPVVQLMELTVGEHVLKWGRTFFDEFHNAKSEVTRFARLYDTLRAHNSGYQWKSWAISGTPLEHGLREVLIFVTKALRGLDDGTGLSNWCSRDKTTRGKGKVTWVDNLYDDIASRPAPPSKGKPTVDAGDKRIRYEPLGLQMAKSWQKLGRSAKGEGYKHIVGTEHYTKLVEVGSRICAAFMLRRTLETNDPWGERISALPGLFHVVIRPCKDGSWSHKVESGRERIKAVLLGTSSGYEAFTRSEMTAIATFPTLAEWKADRVEDDGVNAMSCLKGDALKPHFKNLKSTPLYNDIDELITGSAKIVELMKVAATVDKAMRPNPRHDGTKPATTEPKELPAKLLVLTYKPVGQLLTFLALRKKYGINSVLMLPGGLTSRLLAERLAEWKKDNGPRFMVCSMAYAEAITLVEANFVVIMEPQDRQSKQDQALFRVYRLGQEAAMTWGYILYNVDSQQETEILERQRLKTGSRTELQRGEDEKLDTMTGGDIDWSKGDVVYKIDGLP